jgi:signal peptidase
MIRTKTDTDALTRGRRYLSFAGHLALWAIVAFSFYFLWPSTLGGASTFVIVAGHSMEPTYVPGDLVVARKGIPAVGDIVVYIPEGYPRARVVHQIVGGDGVTGWDVKGINNSWHDPWTPTNAEVVGIVHTRIPDAGVVTSILLSPLLWASVIFVAIGLLVWPEPAPGSADVEAPAGPESTARPSVDRAPRSAREPGGSTRPARPVPRVRVR